MSVKMIEVEDGLLVSDCSAVVKARSLDLFPVQVRSYFAKRNEVIKMEKGIERVSIITENNHSEFDKDLIEYVTQHEILEYTLADVELPGEGLPCYILFAEYEYGIIAVFPMEM
jgi:hypothetical protein